MTHAEKGEENSRPREGLGKVPRGSMLSVLKNSKEADVTGVERARGRLGDVVSRVAGTSLC